MYQNGGSQYVHADIHEIVFRDGSTNQFVITTDGGVFYSANANLAVCQYFFHASSPIQFLGVCDESFLSCLRGGACYIFLESSFR